jgi:hypothetical protein
MGMPGGIPGPLEDERMTVVWAPARFEELEKKSRPARPRSEMPANSSFRRRLIGGFMGEFLVSLA